MPYYLSANKVGETPSNVPFSANTVYNNQNLSIPGACSNININSCK